MAIPWSTPPGDGADRPDFLARQLRACFTLVIIGVFVALAWMAAAWAIYPGGYDWSNRDLSTLGRLFTVNGRGHHTYYPVYNFGLLAWGAAGAVFFAARSMLPASRRARTVWRHGAWLFGLGITAIGIVPADAPHGHWHVMGSVGAGVAFLAGMACLRREDEPGRRYWRLGAAAILAALFLFKLFSVPHGGALAQKALVLFVFAYMTVQAWRLRRGLGTGERAAAADALPAAQRFSGRLLVVGVVALLALMALAIAVFPGGFAWHGHWTSRLGDVFLAKPYVRENMHTEFMVYNGALAVGGVALAVFWTLRSLSCVTAASAWIMLAAGTLMGCGLTAIGMAPTGALGLHRLGIQTVMLTVPLLQLLLLRRGANAAGPVWGRCLFPALTIGSGALFALLGSGYGKLGQKVLIVEACLWFLWLGVAEWRRGAKAPAEEP